VKLERGLIFVVSERERERTVNEDVPGSTTLSLLFPVVPSHEREQSTHHHQPTNQQKREISPLSQQHQDKNKRGENCKS
jgi:hypothetical protein